MLSESGDLNPDFFIPKNFPVLKNDRILKAARGESVDKIPVWVMRQAGRYLPEFRELRKKHSFFEICKTPSLACEATLLPIRRFKLDAAIIFSDILVIPEAMGLGVKMVEGIGPVIANPLQPDQVESLNTDGVIERLQYVGEAITLTRHKLEGSVPLFGFSGAPWTLLSYMIEGSGSKTWSKAKRWLYQYPEESHMALNILTDFIIDYLVMQVKAGAQILQIFDTNAEYLNKFLYKEFGLPYLKKVRDVVKHKLNEQDLEDVPMVLFAKGASYCLNEQADLGFEVISVDWTVETELVGEILRNKDITVQGNLDPCALYAPLYKIRNLTVYMVDNMVEAVGSHRYIANLGHGIYPDMEPEAVEEFVEAVHRVVLD